MVDFSFCIIPLMLSGLYLLIYVTALLILLLRNKFKLKAQFKIVLCILFAALVIQVVSCLIPFMPNGSEFTWE